MKVDLYTKAVLTIIALCLIWLCVRGSVSQPVQAATAQEVKIVGIELPDRNHPINTTYFQALKAKGLSDALNISR